MTFEKQTIKATLIAVFSGLLAIANVAATKVVTIEGISITADIGLCGPA